MGLDGLCYCSKHFRMVHGDVCKYLTIDRNILVFQAKHQARICCTVYASRSIDADDPQRAERTLFVTTVTICVLQTLFDVVLCNRPNF